MKLTIYCLIIMVLPLLFSCEKDSELSPSQPRIKRKIYYFSAEDTIPRRIFEYEYDSKNRIIKIQDNLYAELFEYDKNNQLIKKYNYQLDGKNCSLSDTTFYSYKDGKIVSEEKVYLPDQYRIKYVYEYENDKLIKKKEYRNQICDGMTLYEYESDLCSKETYYTDSLATRTHSHRRFIYDGSKLSMSAMIGYRGETLQVVYYLYDENGNLIIEDGQQIAEVAAVLCFYFKYEYF